MKVLKLLMVLIVISTLGYGQTTPWSSSPSVTPQTRTYNGTKQIRWLWGTSSLYSVEDSIDAVSPVTTAAITILQAPQIGTIIPSGTSFENALKIVFAPPQPPIVSAGTTTTYPLTSASTQSQTFSYSYSKATGTSNFATATFAGSTTGITQNVNGASGTISKTFSTNSDLSYTFTATTVDPISRSAVINIYYRPHLLYGRATSQPAVSSELTAHNGGGDILTNSHASGPGGFTVTASGSNYPFIAYPASEGAITSFTLTNGTDITTLFTLTTASYTSVEGYTQTYNIYTMNAAQTANLTFVTN